MDQNRDEIKLLSQELKDPYKQLNTIFLLVSIIPSLACVYIVYGKLLVREPLPPDLVPVFFFSNLIMILGYFIGHRVIKNILKKVLSYATRARLSEQQRLSMAVALAHDLKSPLTVIKANMGNFKAGLLGPLSPQQKDMANLCSQVTDRTASMLTDLIKTYSPQEGPSEMQITRIDLREIVEEQLREVAAVAEGKNVSLKSELSKNVLPLNADSGMILRVVNNLLSNAIKYTPLGGVIRVKASMAEGFVQLHVMNSGDPIPEDRLERIFESYERLDNSAEEGQGLGLGIARAITEAHGGKVWAESGVGKMNCFTVLLPLAGK